MKTAAGEGNGVSDGSNGAAAYDGETSAASEPPKTSVTFRTQHGVAYGETIKVVGDSAYLGAWEIAAAPGARLTGRLCGLVAYLPQYGHRVVMINVVQMPASQVELPYFAC